MYVRRQCPFCVGKTGSRGNRPFGAHVAVEVDLGWFKCYRCGARGRLDEKNAKLLDVDSVPFSRHEQKRSQRDHFESREQPEGFTTLRPAASSAESLVLSRYIRYLVRRGVERDTIDHFGIGALLGSYVKPYPYRGALAIPTHDSVCPGHVLRLRSGEYRSPGVYRGKGAFFNGRLLDESDGLPVIVVEGPFDCICLYPGRAVAGYGKDLTKEQMKRLAQYSGPVTFALDGDAWQESEMLVLELCLLGHGASSWLRLPPGRDPGDLGLSGVMGLEKRQALD